MKNLSISMVWLLFAFMISCQSQSQSINNSQKNNTVMEDSNLEKATFGAGCFWCIEAAFDQLEGVNKVESGYAGGHLKNPSYKAVTTGSTGHAEVIQVTYDPKVISYDSLLDAFWVVHDPTQLNRQGNDVGTQYRSEIFYHNDEQKRLAEESIEKLKASNTYSDPIVTKLSSLDNNFYLAEDYHTDYYELNKTQPYCSAVIAPKLQKFYSKFKNKLKPEFQ